MVNMCICREVIDYIAENGRFDIFSLKLGYIYRAVLIHAA